MKFNKIIPFTLAIVVLAACEKVISVDLNSAAPQLVIEGEVTNAAGPYQVKLSKTVNFSSSNVFPPVSGAMVQITDTGGATDVLTETSPGIYSTHTLLGKPGKTYSLSVTAEGKQYSAVSTMPAPVNLDSITFEKTSFFNNKRTYAVVNFQDPVGLGNYYRFTEYINGVVVPAAFVIEDRLSDGKYVSRTLFSDTANLVNGDNLSIRMNCIDESNYSYFRTYRIVTSNDNRSASPANPNSNISNGALGYFSAHTVQTKQVTVH
ncbi:MAG: DUF4249 domain-containing protein [Bacteroidota bacterium]|nr:DUF4249 domain-containing protein [Bacteroidota bacterium]